MKEDEECVALLNKLWDLQGMNNDVIAYYCLCRVECGLCTQKPKAIDPVS